ncbi:thioredoxin [Blastopirellula marina]|uniref:Thioredoxin n=1 Tax=Blastopirellula marina TaxID=124 RepID=A0A2S8FI02_9BACT|nr:thioredoxin [Blastopirellula marina]PQO31771.1 thioredoxin [Blastopirellula marina]PTL43078.1 thioredoxin [Blastopirellula marina]
MANVFNEDNFDAEVLQSSNPVLVDFWAPWCGPCRQLAPVIDQLATEYEGSVKVGKVDTDQNPNLAVKYGIQSIPTIMIFKNGEVVNQMLGNQPKANLQQALDAAKG